MSSACSLSDEVANVARYNEGRLYGDVSSEASSDAADDFELPDTKIKRNYSCMKCNFYTQNPRAFLHHNKNVHLEQFRIYDCPSCMYASKHQQKLVRHMRMVHENAASNDVEKARPDESITSDMNEEPINIENMLEEIEEPLDVDNEDLIEESYEDAEMESECNQQTTSQPPAALDQNQKYFSCVKCNYVTHIKSRFKKHVKYHSMPMIKCTLCDFRTPYKWNLDRHMKNHGGTGSFHCSMCNFTADIKQSLTVHEMNHHHTSPAGQAQAGQSRRRNRVGASDLSLTDNAVQHLITKEEEGSGDSHSSYVTMDNAGHEADIELISCNSGSNDMTEPKIEESSSNSQSEQTKFCKQNRKPRPIPQLIPLNTSTPTNNKNLSTGEPPLKKMREMLNNVSDNSDDQTNHKMETDPNDASLVSFKNNFNQKDPQTTNKKESFFKKLKQGLLAETSEMICKNCGFESKCLSEHSVHEKNCSSSANRNAPTSISSSGSTRCQNCRHRCKSSADLFVHMQTCKSNKSDEVQSDAKVGNDDPMNSSSQPHPMENVVFVWNNINQDSKQFEMPLDININDDSTLPDHNQSFDPDSIEENDGLNLSPTQAIGKKVFKCPHCPFWATTASRFHVHIVGHLNKKPFECSLCKYKSNWRWDITKHIKLKSARDPEHNQAKVLMTDETGRRNYSKYNKFLAMPVTNENGENEFHYVDQEAATQDTADLDEAIHDAAGSSNENRPFNLHIQNTFNNGESSEPPKVKKTLWKCKKCNYKDPSKDALLEHVRQHSKSMDGNNYAQNKKVENKDPADLAYRCGHCNQLSNWKHVIQRHCRLKHDGIIKVIGVEKPKQDSNMPFGDSDSCTKCPFRSNDKKMLVMHIQQHTPSAQSIFKCYFCPFFVKNENELHDHLLLHGVHDPEEYISKVMDGKAEQSIPKRHKCTDCPYETNSKSQYMYHEQFHRESTDTPYKCPECNYSVSKRHLLHQHLKVHGIYSKKFEGDSENEASTSHTIDMRTEENYDEVPHVWVAAKNEFHKMFKCRYCSYVNSQNCKIPNHEKIHYILSEFGDITGYKCWECKFTCDNAVRLSEHSKVHGELYGRIYCSVDNSVSDEEQILHLRNMVEEEKLAMMDSCKDDMSAKGMEEGRSLLHFCFKCPARYFNETDLRKHDKYHDLTFPYKCNSCEFSVPIENQLSNHIFVHSDDYQNKTKMLKAIHETHPDHREPKLEPFVSPGISEIAWVVTRNGELDFQSFAKPPNEPKQPLKQYSCKECPAKFFKTSTLSYHMGLHGGDGEHKCKKCSYSVKNVGHLAKHEQLHEKENKTPACEYDSGEDLDFKNVPLSGTDLFQRKTEAQKRVVIDKDKLVKPNDHFPPVLQADPQFGYLMHGNPEFVYPTYLKNGRQKEKRYKCHKCPSAFEKREQYKIHLSLHGSKQRYKCEICDYSVKYYANYVQHMRKHQMNDEALAERRKENGQLDEPEIKTTTPEEGANEVKLAIKTIPKGVVKSDFQQFSVNDQQTLRLLQRRRSINSMTKDSLISEPQPTKDRKLHSCTLCPYTNQRLDALNNHYRRHDNVDINNAGHNKCTFCDLAVVQSHFLRDHIKSHFMYQKNLTAQGFSANEGVKFIIKKLDEDKTPDITLEIKTSEADSLVNSEKVIVQLSIGEILVE